MEGECSIVYGSGALQHQLCKKFPSKKPQALPEKDVMLEASSTTPTPLFIFGESGTPGPERRQDLTLSHTFIFDPPHQRHRWRRPGDRPGDQTRRQMEQN